MTTTAHRDTAKIYIFPTRPRVKADTFGGEASAVVSLTAKRAVHVSFDAWYHDEAIEQAARDKSN